MSDAAAVGTVSLGKGAPVTDERVAEVADELAAICERLDEIAYEALAAAVSEGANSRPELERRVVRARNAIDRARRMLTADADSDGADGQP